MKRKATTVTLVSLLVLVLTVQPSYAILGIFDIVYDPTVEATIAVQTAMQSTNWVQQLLNQVEQIKTAVDSYIKLKETYDKIKETYDLAKKMSQYLTGLDAYALALGGWQGPGGSKDLFGVTSGIQMAMGGSLSPELGKSYGNSTNPLNSYAAEVYCLDERAHQRQNQGKRLHGHHCRCRLTASIRNRWQCRGRHRRLRTQSRRTHVCSLVRRSGHEYPCRPAQPH